jgi:cell division transport system permease protein
MQLKYVFSETGNGLKRNVSMTIALVVTIFISLTLVGLGLLLNAQANKAEHYWGSKLQISVVLCNQNSRSPHCTSGETNPAQQAAIVDVLDTHPEVASYTYETKAEAFKTWKKIYVSKDAEERQIYAAVTEKDMQNSYRVTLKNPQKYRGVESALSGMDGVDKVNDLRDVLQPILTTFNKMKWGALVVAAFLLLAAVLQVSNAIRLAAFARRKEIGIMRLVGASNLYISLPFLMETLVAAVVGVAGAALAVGGVMYFFVYGNLRPDLHVVEWVSWRDAGMALAQVAVLGILATLIPTLVTTRKYLKV